VKFWQGFLGRVVVAFLSGVAAKEHLTSYTFVAKENKYVCEAVDRLTQSSCSADIRILRSKNSLEQKAALTFTVFLQAFVFPGDGNSCSFWVSENSEKIEPKKKERHWLK